jgi:hypothetical protein
MVTVAGFEGLGPLVRAGYVVSRDICRVLFTAEAQKKHLSGFTPAEQGPPPEAADDEETECRWTWSISTSW